MRTRRVLADAATSALLLVIWAQPGCNRADDPFYDARQLIVRGNYVEGEAAMRKIVDDSPQGEFASRAGLFLFKASVAQGELDQARTWCHWTIDNHPESLEAHKCQYKLGMIEMMEGRRREAVERFEELAGNPSGPLAAEAQGMTQFLQAFRLEPEDADP